MLHKLFFAACFAFAGALLLIAAPAHAITIIPPSLEFEAPPSQPYETSVKLFNETDSTVTLYTQATNFGAVGETGRPSYRFDADPEGLSSWITIDGGPFEISPQERITVPITVNPPDNAEPGGHYAAVFFSDTPPDADEAGAVTVGTKIGILLLARVPGDIDELGSIKEFYIEEGNATINRLPLTFVTRFQNSGNVHLRPTGSIEVSNMLGSSVATIEFNPANGATLPKTIRKYDTTWQKGDIESGSGFWTEFKNERNNFGIGQYTAVLTAEAGIDTELNDSATVKFWVVPWRVMIVWGIGIIIILIILWLLLKQYNKWIIAKATNQQQSSPANPKPSKKKQDTTDTPDKK